MMFGGFTLSGGEPLMQDRFAARLFTAAKSLGIHTALDTNGFLGERLSDKELDEIDVVLLDIKSFDPERHQRLTAKDNGPTLEFACRLARQKKTIWLRYVLVPGLTDDVDDINQTAEFAAELGNVARVDVLPFHQMGRYKWKKLGLEYALDEVEPPRRELVDRVCEQFRSVGLKAH
jgi:pyruvate formate lyase activating enzyme